MFTLFKRVRQKLLTENRITKYLLYALGEILLVVIGILIALQVNNWNEGKKERSREAVYLERLLDDFTRDSLSLQSSILLTGHKINQGDTLLQQLRENIPVVDTAQFVFDAFLVGRGGSFRPYIPSYQKLIVSGNINTIRNDSITTQIARYLNRVDGFETFVYNEGDYRRRSYNEHLHRYFSARIMPEIWKTARDSMISTVVIQRLGADLNSFREDPGSVYHIQNVSALNAELNHLYRQSMERYVQPILKMLRTEVLDNPNRP